METAYATPRKHRRYGIEVPVVFSWKDELQARRQDIGLTRDLSVRGAFIVATTCPPPGATIKLKAFLPTGSSIEPVRFQWQGEVVRLEQGRDHAPAGFAVSAKQQIALRRGRAPRWPT